MLIEKAFLRGASATAIVVYKAAVRFR